jgi:hypothetical protein
MIPTVPYHVNDTLCGLIGDLLIFVIEKPISELEVPLRPVLNNCTSVDEVNELIFISSHDTLA